VNFLSDNLAIITERWPSLAQQLHSSHYDTSQVELVEDKQLSLVFDNIQIASSYDQEAEANIQIAKLPTDTEKLTLYGTGLGMVQNLLLNKNSLHAFDVVVLNLPLFKACLTYFDQQAWLLNERVTLQLANKKTKVNQPFIALPAELVLATNDSASLRDRVCLALDDEFINKNKGIANKEVQKSIMKNLSFIKNDHDISEFFSGENKDSKKTDFIICGAGPTLAEHYNWLQQTSTREQFTIIAVDAAVMPLAQAGIIADIIVSIDPVAKKLLACLNMEDFKQVPLVYFPVVSSELLSLWRGPRYTAYSTGELYQQINAKQPRGRLYCAGSVIHPAIDLSVKMAATKVLLLGADFSFPEGKSHTYWQDDNSNNSIHLTTKETNHWVLNGFNERVATLLNYRGYLRDLEDYISLAKQVEFFNGSKKGALIAGTKFFFKDKLRDNEHSEKNDLEKNNLQCGEI